VPSRAITTTSMIVMATRKRACRPNFIGIIRPAP
jgi:hypothetical protein